MKLSFWIPTLTSIFVSAGALALLSLPLNASAQQITVPGAVRAIEQYEEAVEKAQNNYHNAEEQAEDRWDEEAFYNRATATYQREMQEATAELTAELVRIEDWLLEQVELLRAKREAAKVAENEALEASPIFGELVVVIKGRLDIYLNGVSVASFPDSNTTHHIRTKMRIKPGDLLVFSAQSPYVYRSFRASFIAEDSPLFINNNNLQRIAKTNPQEITVEDLEAGKPTAVGRSEAKMDELWESFRLKDDKSTWIQLPDRGGPYHFAYQVPSTGV